jgi:GTPase SAR1 family protein
LVEESAWKDSPKFKIVIIGDSGVGKSSLMRAEIIKGSSLSKNTITDTVIIQTFRNVKGH